MVKDAPGGDRVLRAEVAGEGLPQLWDLWAQLALGQLGQDRRVAFASDERLHHGPSRLRQHFGSDRGELDAGVL